MIGWHPILMERGSRIELCACACVCWDDLCALPFGLQCKDMKEGTVPLLPCPSEFQPYQMSNKQDTQGCKSGTHQDVQDVVFLSNMQLRKYWVLGPWVGLIWLLAVDLRMPDLSNTPKVWNDLAAVRRGAKRFEEYHYSFWKNQVKCRRLFWSSDAWENLDLVCCACACVHAFTICIYIWNPRFWGDGLDFLSIYISIYRSI